MSDRGSSRLFDEFARLFTDAASVAQGVRRETETLFRSQAERFISEMDLVRREDFEVVREMASRARAENEKLAARVAELEAKLALGEAVPAKKKAAAKASRAEGAADAGDETPPAAGI